MLSKEQEFNMCKALRDYFDGAWDAVQITEVMFIPSDSNNFYHPRTMLVRLWSDDPTRTESERAFIARKIRDAVFQLQCGFATYFPLTINDYGS